MDVPSSIEIENAEVYGATQGNEASDYKAERNLEFSKHNFNKGMTQIDKNALIAGRLLRIRSEIKQLDQQFKQTSNYQ